MTPTTIPLSEVIAPVEQMYKICQDLLTLAENDIADVDNVSDETLLSYLDKRDPLIEQIRDLEHQIDDNREAYPSSSRDQETQETLHTLKQAIQETLHQISLRDMEAMRVISKRMMNYRNETVKARNKKRVSAYIQASVLQEPLPSVDFKK